MKTQRIAICLVALSRREQMALDRYFFQLLRKHTRDNRHVGAGPFVDQSNRRRSARVPLINGELPAFVRLAQSPRLRLVKTDDDLMPPPVSFQPTAHPMRVADISPDSLALEGTGQDFRLGSLVEVRLATQEFELMTHGRITRVDPL